MIKLCNWSVKSHIWKEKEPYPISESFRSSHSLNSKSFTTKQQVKHTVRLIMKLSCDLPWKLVLQFIGAAVPLKMLSKLSENYFKQCFDHFSFIRTAEYLSTRVISLITMASPTVRSTTMLYGALSVPGVTSQSQAAVSQPCNASSIRSTLSVITAWSSSTREPSRNRTARRTVIHAL